MYTVYDWQPSKEYVDTHYGHEDDVILKRYLVKKD